MNRVHLFRPSRLGPGFQILTKRYYIELHLKRGWLNLKCILIKVHLTAR